MRVERSRLNMFKSIKEALEKFGREIKRLRESEDRDNVTGVDFTDCHDNVFNAASTGWHLIDWTFRYDPTISDNEKKNSDVFGKFRAEREKECPELSLCGDIANKIKHAEITRFRTNDGKTDMDTTETSFIGLEISNKGTRTSVQKCKITLNGERAVEIFSKVFDYWSNYLAPYIGDKLKIPQESIVKSPFGSGLARPGGYYCPTCKIAIGMLIPHNDICNKCGNLYQDLPK